MNAMQLNFELTKETDLVAPCTDLLPLQDNNGTKNREWEAILTAPDREIQEKED